MLFKQAEVYCHTGFQETKEKFWDCTSPAYTFPKTTYSLLATDSPFQYRIDVW